MNRRRNKQSHVVRNATCGLSPSCPRPQSMIPKSGNRFSEKIMFKQ
jgi:hypothetical protein